MVVLSRFRKNCTQALGLWLYKCELCDNILAPLPGTKSKFPGRRHWRGFQLWIFFLAIPLEEQRPCSSQIFEKLMLARWDKVTNIILKAFAAHLGDFIMIRYEYFIYDWAFIVHNEEWLLGCCMECILLLISKMFRGTQTSFSRTMSRISRGSMVILLVLSHTSCHLWDMCPLSRKYMRTSW